MKVQNKVGQFVLALSLQEAANTELKPRYTQILKRVPLHAQEGREVRPERLQEEIKMLMENVEKTVVRTMEIPLPKVPIQLAREALN
jgi:hypothetical protein